MRSTRTLTSRRKHLIWDFDGTLAHREGMWSRTLVQVSQRYGSREIDFDTVRPFLQQGFPWHEPDRAYPRLSADQWWEALHPLFTEAFVGCAVEEREAAHLATKVRTVYTDAREWRVFDDTVAVLSELGEEGWTHSVLSNHVPELRDLVEGLGLARFLGHIVNSAETGYEKPHPEAFRAALAPLGDGAEVWMIGDNVDADVRGAESVGLPAILVRNDSPAAKMRTKTLHGVKELLRAGRRT